MLTSAFGFPCYKQDVSFFYLMRYHIVKELHSNEAYRKFCKISDEVSSIETLSYRTSKMDFNALIQKVILSCMNSIPVIRQKMLLSIQLWLSIAKIIEHNFKESNINIRTNMLLGQRQQSINGNMDTKLISHTIPKHP